MIGSHLKRPSVIAVPLLATLMLAACGGTTESRGTDTVSSPTPGFPVALNRGPEGEIWGVSGSTAVEINDSGRIERAIDLSFLPSPWAIAALAVGIDDRLFLSAVWSDGEAYGDILTYDIATGEHSVAVHQDVPVGDLAVVGDDVVFVSFTADNERSYTVRRLSPSGDVSDLAEFAGDGRRAAIAADAMGVISVTTADGVARLSPTGGILTLWELPAESTGLAVSPAGRVAVTTQDDQACDRLLAVGETGSSRLDGPCLSRGFVWLDESTILVSAGDENGAELIRVAAQPSPSGM